MAGEWIKVRTNLWNDPRVSQICDKTGSAEATVVGGLYWLWSTADEHTETGFMPGLSVSAIDRKTGISGFASALVSIGWVTEADDGIIISRFDEHNGASAKSRAQTAKRQSKLRNNAHVTLDASLQRDSGVTTPSPREEKRREENKEQEPLRAEAPAKRSSDASGSRLPNDWKPSPEDTEYCKTERPDLLPSKVAQNFYDYWIAKPGKDGRKTDWSATWRSWVRKEDSKAAGRPGSVPAQSLKWNPNSQDRSADAEFAAAARKRLGIDGPDDGEEIDI